MEGEKLGDSDGISATTIDCGDTLEGDVEGEIVSESDGCVVGSDDILGDDEMMERKRLKDSEGLCVPLGNCDDAIEGEVEGEILIASDGCIVGCDENIFGDGDGSMEREKLGESNGNRLPIRGFDNTLLVGSNDGEI